MKKQIMLLIFLFTTSLFADGFFALRAGASWPRTISSIPGEKTAFNTGWEWGGMVNNIVGVGGVFDMMFHNTDSEQSVKRDTTQSGGIFETYFDGEGVRRRQFSIGLGLWINPLDDAPFRPVLRANIMPSMMVLINEADTSDVDEVLPPTGAYWGYTGETGGDIHVMITDEISFFVGASYRYGSLRKRINHDYWNWESDDEEEHQYLRQPVNGLALRAGFMLW